MSDAGTPGVLLTAADGSHYFIPDSDLAQYAVSDAPDDLGDRVADAAPRVNAFAVSITDEEDTVAFFPMTEGA